ncbi:response regulator transcription factor [Sediminibacterium roseum]|uniref:Response regulator transcription factor n=1 Tax=Sediminibacterium roseum TaxID=1978412 RepID=A0ABW9ZX97_9BACT|nr:response regulator transcription factor [Sediminibacterium roseum]NCI50337.1 response regulator transcription factor [Sediminibacterium roseum]
MPYKIALVDDKPYVLKTLQAELTESGLAIISFTANNGEHFLQQLEALKPEEYPQVVLMDIDMPVMNGIQAVRTASIRYPSILYIMLTVFDDDDKLFDALRAGAHGYLLKEERSDVILRSVEEVIEKKGAPMSPRIARKTLQLLLNEPSGPAGSNIENSGLSAREIEILQSMVAGLDYKQIGEKLFISPNTVRNHISKIYDKLHISSKAEAIKLAIKNKWTG